MAYVKNQWKAKDTITSAKLNNMEDGIDGALNRAAIPGPAGPQGERGETGLAGPQGEKGGTGEAGQAGMEGKSVTVVTFVKNTEGQITGGTASLSDGSAVTITVTEEG